MSKHELNISIALGVNDLCRSFLLELTKSFILSRHSWTKICDDHCKDKDYLIIGDFDEITVVFNSEEDKFLFIIGNS